MGIGYPRASRKTNGHQIGKRGNLPCRYHKPRETENAWPRSRNRGGRNVLLRLHRQEVKALEFLAKYHDMDKGKLMAYLLMEESRRVSTLLLSNPDKLREFVEKD